MDQVRKGPYRVSAIDLAVYLAIHGELVEEIDEHQHCEQALIQATRMLAAVGFED